MKKDFKIQQANTLPYENRPQLCTRDGPKDRDCPEILHPHWNYRKYISLENGLLFKDNRLIVAEAERNQIESLYCRHY